MSYSPDDELASWKEIAGYLGIAVRTAQLWERERHLPVRRLPGGRGRVSASVASLEKWKGLASDAAECQSAVAVEDGEEPFSSSEPKPFPTARVVAVAFLFGAAILTGLTVPGHSRKPVSARVERDTLAVFDANGREVWQKPFPYPLGESSSPQRAAAFTWVGDLDGDGGSEVLFAPHRIDGTPESSPLICFDERGSVRWTYKNERHVRTADEHFSGIYAIAGFLVAPRGKNRGNVVLVSTTHSIYYPTQLALLMPDGRAVREYWHSGHLNHLQTADLNGDGRPEFYLAGINNARHSATLVVLDEDHFGGASREEPQYQLLGFSPGAEMSRLVIPQTCLSRRIDPYNPVVTFTVTPEEVVIQTNEDIRANAGVFHHLSIDFRSRRAVIADSYKIEHRRELLARELTESSCPLDSVPDIEFLTH